MSFPNLRRTASREDFPKYEREKTAQAHANANVKIRFELVWFLQTVKQAPSSNKQAAAPAQNNAEKVNNPFVPLQVQTSQR